MPSHTWPHLLNRSDPTASARSWQRGKAYDYDATFDVLIPCSRCGRKAGGVGKTRGLKLWRVAHHVENRSAGFGMARWAERMPWVPFAWTRARIECADEAECRAYMQERTSKQRSAAERRSPPLPYVDAPAHHCKWCGLEIEYVETASYQRRQRTLHRGDEWELGDTDCRRPAWIWRDPTAATQQLLEAQCGDCATCMQPLAELVERRYFDYELDTLGDPRLVWEQIPPGQGGPVRGWAVDHITPLVDGGMNIIENLQVICQSPCHNAKTAAEAKARARGRRRQRGEPEPIPAGRGQMALA